MSENIIKTRLQLKRETSENWAKATNFIPKEGEPILYTDLNMVKFGDGVTAVNDLPFADNKLDSVAKIWYKEQEEDGTKVNAWQITYTDDLSTNVNNYQVHDDSSKITLWRDNLKQYPIGSNFYEVADKDYYDFGTAETENLSYTIEDGNVLKVAGTSYLNGAKVVLDNGGIDFMKPITSDYAFMFDFKFNNDDPNVRNTGFQFNPFKGYYFGKPWTSNGDILRITVRQLSYQLGHKVDGVMDKPIDKMFTTEKKNPLPSNTWFTFVCKLSLGKISFKVWDKNQPDIVYIDEVYRTPYITSETLIAPKLQGIDIANYINPEETNNNLFYEVSFADFRIYRENVMDIEMPEIPVTIQDVRYNNNINAYEKIYSNGNIETIDPTTIVIDEKFDNLNNWSINFGGISKDTDFCEAENNVLKLKIDGDTTTGNNRYIDLTSKENTAGSYALEFDYIRTSDTAGNPFEVRLLGSGNTAIRAYIDVNSNGEVAFYQASKKGYQQATNIEDGTKMLIQPNISYHFNIIVVPYLLYMFVTDSDGNQYTIVSDESTLTKELLTTSYKPFSRYGNTTKTGLYTAEISNLKQYYDQNVQAIETYALLQRMIKFN